MDREQIVTTLGSMMDQAARASITRGALYDPGEKISSDSAGAWRGVAEALVRMVEQGLDSTRREIERG